VVVVVRSSHVALQGLFKSRDQVSGCSRWVLTELFASDYVINMDVIILDGLAFGWFQLDRKLSGDVIAFRGSTPTIIARACSDGGIRVPWGRVRLSKLGKRLAKRIFQVSSFRRT
jgi:hypothetical protein